MLKFELPEQMVAIIGQALDKMPYGLVKATVDELQRQINEQRKPREDDRR